MFFAILSTKLVVVSYKLRQRSLITAKVSGVKMAIFLSIFQFCQLGFMFFYDLSTNTK